MPSANVRGKGARRRFYVRWKVGPKQWKKEVYHCETLTQAKDEARRREEAVEDRRHGKKRLKDDITIRRAVYEEYLPSLPPGYASYNSLEGRFRNRILPKVVEGKRKVEELMCRELDSGHVRKVLAQNADCEPATREQLRVSIQGLYTFLKGAKRVEENPGADTPKVRIPKRKPRFLKPLDIPRFIAAVPTLRRLHFSFNLGTGARKGQSLNLEWKDVHEDEGYVVLFGKDNEENLVPLADWLCILLRAHRAESKSRWVFPKPEGLKDAGKKQPKWVDLAGMVRRALVEAGLIEHYAVKCVTRGKMKGCDFKDARKERGELACPECGRNTLQITPVPIHITFHNLRSTFATWAYAHTRDIRFVQLVLGHSDTRVTARYAAVIDDHMRALANRVQLNPFATEASPGTPGANLRPFGVTVGTGAPRALPTDPGTPMGHANANGVLPGVSQGFSVPTQAIGVTRDDAP